ncbi:Esterase EstA [Bradyrhizobium ivorense]|uniref:Esterase EstA n=1 Tax=Bradyrhizobium ivorense TaxID=2511166 RepID=A0A508TKI1_9BRAD|nr:autotransporter domain-containing protein [Bradyrhizobium ivorense]VIO74869.1 Esterase EstA [Bradyrhizobium ivorense]
MMLDFVSVRFAKANGRFLRKPTITSGGVLLLAAALLMLDTSASHAQSRYVSLTAFGDSYADSGINNFLKVVANPSAYPSSGASPSAVAAATPYVAYPYWIQSQLGLADAQVKNYAIGGSTTQVLNAYGTSVSLPFQLANWNGKTFGPNDLVTISIGGNDALTASGAVYPLLGFGPTGQQFTASAATTLASQSTANATAAIKQLAAAGARNFVLAGFSDMNGLPQSAAAPFPANQTLYSQVYFQGLQTSLQPLAQSGIRIFLVDEAKLIRQVGANLAGYGFNSYQYVNASQQSLFQPEGVHLTTHGFEVLAAYMTNLIKAPDTVAAQGEISQLVAANFAGSIFQRLDAYRNVGSYGESLNNALAYAPAGTPTKYVKAPPGSEMPLSVYLEGSHYSGRRDDSVGANGFDYDVEGATFGSAYRVNPNTQVGVAFNYSNPKADLTHSAGKIDVNTYQFGAFVSSEYRNWFVDAVATYGHNQYRLERAGILDVVRATTSGDTFTIGAKGGYLFDLGSVRLGPIAALNYARSHIGGYTEAGDPLLTFSVSQPDLESLIASAGIQLRAPFYIDTTRVSPFLNLTAEHDFIGSDRTILSIETQAPLLPIYSAVPGLTAGTYGKVAGGLSAQFSDRFSAELHAASTFARASGNDFGVGGSLKLAFAAR